jgi:hypothetical protein
MRKFVIAGLSALLAIPMLAVPAAAAPGDAQLSVVHGVPGLVVDVYVDGAEVIPDFEFETVAGPLTVASGTHEVEVFVDGSDPMMDAPALEATVELPPGANVTAVAHLDEAGSPTLSVYVNDTSFTTAGQGRVVVRHTAEAPAVDVLVNGGVAFAGLANPDEAQADLAPGTYDVTLNAAGTDTQAFPATGAVPLGVTANASVIVYAIGSLGTDFTLAVQSIDLGTAAGFGLVDVVHGVPGVSVDVYANGLPLLTGFDFEDIASQVLLPAGTYDIAIYAEGSDPIATAPVISAPGIEVTPGLNAAVVAHLDEGGTPTASVFVNDISTIEEGDARVTVRHTAAAPAVDVLADGGVLVENLANGEGAAADVPANTYGVALNAAGTDTQAFPATGELDVELVEGVNTIVYAVGTLGSDFTVLVSTLTGLGEAGAFPDVAGSVHARNIAIIALANIARGYDNGNFGPEDSVTRGQMAAFLTRALQLPASSVDAFSDDDGTLFEADINAIAAFGITRGNADGTFASDATITRGQMAAFLNRAFVLPAGGDTPFTDIADSEFAADIAALYASGITVGTSDTTFSPEDEVSRGQMATFLARALGLGS